MGYGEADTASVCAVLQTMAGVRRGKPAGKAKRSKPR